MTNREGIPRIEPLSACVDHYAATSKEPGALEQVKGVLGEDGWERCKSGLRGYRCQERKGEFQLLSDGSEGMGVHLIIGGKGCRQLEQFFEGRDTVNDWPAWILTAQKLGFEATRVDVAVDDRAGLVDMDVVRQAVTDRMIVSHFQKVRELNEHNLSGPSKGRTFYFGSPSSEKMIRFYDKAAEQNEPGHWTRVEAQVRGEQADRLAGMIADRRPFGDLVSGVIAGALVFCRGPRRSVRSRLEIAPWWLKFVGKVDKVRLTVKPEVPTIEQVYAWIRSQVAPKLAVLCEHAGNWEFLVELMEDGKRRWGASHRALILQPG